MKETLKTFIRPNAGVNPTTNTSRASLSASAISHFWYFRHKKNPGRVTNRQSYKEQNLKSFQCQFHTKKKIHKRGEGGMNLTKN